MKKPLTLSPVSSEKEVWEAIDALWKPVFGDFRRQGVSIEWHEFDLAEDWDWRGSFHPRSLEICLNYSGRAELGSGANILALGPEMVSLYVTGSTAPNAVRFSGSLHRFMTLEFSPEYLNSQFEASIENLNPDVRTFLKNPLSPSSCSKVMPMPARMTPLRSQLLFPPVPEAALGIWFQSKILEVLAQTLFHEDKNDQSLEGQHERLNRDRVERVRTLLERDYENPPSLDMLAREVKCSPFHLSRLFRQGTGSSIPRYLRKFRIEKAAELLLSGEYNVTEATMAVGYSSLSAFNKAFVEQMGCCPGLYPVLKRGGRVIKQ